MKIKQPMKKHFPLDISEKATDLLSRVSLYKGLEHLLMRDGSHELACEFIIELRAISAENKKHLDNNPTDSNWMEKLQ